MVYPDISDLKSSSLSFEKNTISQIIDAQPHQRILSAVIDYFIFSPIVLFILTTIFSDALVLIKNFPQSLEVQTVMVMMAGGYVLLFSFLQAVFIARYGSTPGQTFSKTFVEFENDQFPVFFQAWLRQLGFVISFLLLGLPFISIFYHPQNKTFYDRLTESRVKTKVNLAQNHFLWSMTEKKYLSTAVATFFVFSLALFGALGVVSYQKTVQSALTYRDLEKKQIFCEELEGVAQDQKLIVGIGLNLIGKLSNQCLEKEADFVLWKQSGMRLQNFNYNQSMAYFSKFIATESEMKEEKYLDLACQVDPQSRGCLLAKDFKNLSYEEFYKHIQKKNSQNDHVDQLDRILELEFARLVHPDDLIKVLKDLKNEQYVGLKLFLVQEKLKIIHQQQISQYQQRSPAQERESSNSSLTDASLKINDSTLLEQVLQEINEL